MPTYEYACSGCKNQWEEIQKISEPALEICPKCLQHTARRQISGGRFILKGGGWYADLYSSSKPGSSSKKDDGGGTNTASDAKTATKSDAPKESASSSKDSSSKDSGTPSPSSPPASKT